MKQLISLALLISGGLITPVTSNAEEPMALPGVTVMGKHDPARPGRTELKQTLSNVPGGTNLLDLDETLTGNATLNDVLGNEPGIIMQEFFGGNDQPRLNIRGSGIQDNPVARGVQLLYDGMPVNQPDGSFVLGLLPTEQMRFVSVYRGANAFQYGGSTLGGAINMSSRTGLNSENFIRLQGGSFDTFNGSLGVGGTYDKWDYYVGAGYSRLDGFRHQNDGERTNVSFNTGYRFNDNVENRTWFNYTDNHFQIPFVVQKQIAHDHPRAVIGDGFANNFPPPATLPAPAVGHPVFGWNARGGWDGLFDANKRNPFRDSEQFRLANKTYVSTENTDYEFGVYGELLDDTFTDPLSHTVIESKNIGFNYSLLNTASYLTQKDQFLLSISFNAGEMPTEYWVNNPQNGSRLFRFGDLDMDALNSAIGIQYTGNVTENIQLIAGLQWLHSEREIKGTGSTPPSPASFDKVVVNIDRDFTYDAFNPKIGLIFKPMDDVKIFANISRSMEAPTFNHLVTRTVSPLIVPGVTVNPPAVPPFADAAIGSGIAIKNLDDQVAWTFEVGTQGSWKNLSWQASYYYSKVEDELITLVTGFAVNAETFNYPADTIHQGVELGLDAVLGKGLFLPNDKITAKLVYNYSDFTFDGGMFDGNQIAGIPEHLGYTELAYHIGDNFFIAPNIRWQPSDTFVDHSNTLVQDDYLLLGLKASYQPIESKSLRFFSDLKNITDTRYESSYVIRGISSATQPTFLPGSGFSVMVGAEFTW
jgi:iron complex outermembrane receptor protein